MRAQIRTSDRQARLEIKFLYPSSTRTEYVKKMYKTVFILYVSIIKVYLQYQLQLFIYNWGSGYVHKIDMYTVSKPTGYFRTI